jgi:hypothetical protein
MGANSLFGAFESDCSAVSRTSLSNVQAKLFGLFGRPNTVVGAHSHLPENAADSRPFRIGVKKMSRGRPTDCFRFRVQMNAQTEGHFRTLVGEMRQRRLCDKNCKT